MDPMGAAFWLLFILHQVHNTITFNHCIKNCIPVPCGKHPRLSCSCLCGEILKSHTTCLQNFTLFEQAKGNKHDLSMHIVYIYSIPTNGTSLLGPIYIYMFFPTITSEFRCQSSVVYMKHLTARFLDPNNHEGLTSAHKNPPGGSFLHTSIT